MTADLVAFLRARLDEDHETARLVLGVNVMAGVKRGKPAPRWEKREDGSIRDASDESTPRVKFTWAREAEHIIRHDPARVLADVEAKRQRIDLLAAAIEAGHDSSDIASELLPLEALPYADHPDYRPEWAPTLA